MTYFVPGLVFGEQPFCHISKTLIKNLLVEYIYPKFCHLIYHMVLCFRAQVFHSNVYMIKS